MVQAISSQSKKASIFSIFALLSFWWFPPLGLGFGIAGLVYALKLRKQNQAVPTASKGTPQLILSCISIVGALAVLAFFVATLISGASGLGAVIGNTLKSSQEYPEAVETISSAKKEFSVNETVAFGPFDIAVSGIQRGYTPTPDENANIQARLAKLRDDPYFDDHNSYNQNLSEQDFVYTKFIFDVTHNTERGVIYDRLLMDVHAWGDALADLKLDGAECISVIPSARELEKYNASYKTGYTDAANIQYICIGSTPTPTVATLDVSFFSKLSPLVGTEGMPRQKVTYSVQF